jgi:hypothetical protein
MRPSRESAATALRDKEQIVTVAVRKLASAEAGGRNMRV